MKSCNHKFYGLSVPFSIISFFCVLIISFNSREISEGITSAINMILNVTVPALFPVFTVSYFFLNSGLKESTRRKLHTVFFRSFGLSGNCMEAVLCGLTGGYNISLKAAVRLFNDKKISREEAQRLSLFFTCPGISFCLNIAGIAVYNSRLTGLFILISNILSSVISAAVFNLFKKNTPSYLPFNDKKSFSSALINAVNGSSSAIISVSFWIILFSAVNSVAVKLIKAPFITELLTLSGEVTASVFYASKHHSIYVLSFFLTFGGICIFLQQLPDLYTVGIPAIKFLSVRLIQSLLSTVILKIFLTFLPLLQFTSVPVYTFKAASGTFYASLSLFLLCAVTMMSNRYKEKHGIRQYKKRIYNNRTCEQK